MLIRVISLLFFSIFTFLETKFMRDMLNFIGHSKHEIGEFEVSPLKKIGYALA